MRLYFDGRELLRDQYVVYQTPQNISRGVNIRGNVAIFFTNNAYRMEKFELSSMRDAQKSAEEIRRAAIVRKKARESKGYDPDTEPSGEDYRIAEKTIELSNAEREKITIWAKQIVTSWHDDIRPDYVFLTETAAIAYGYVIKETWRSAYPDEELPKFFRINPGAPIIHGTRKIYDQDTRNWDSQEIDDDKFDSFVGYFINKRITTSNPRIIVFDEGGSQGWTGMEAIAQFSKDDKVIYHDYSGNFLDNENIPIATTSTSGSSGKVAETIRKILEATKGNASIWTSRQTIQDKTPKYYNEPDAITRRTYATKEIIQITKKIFRKGLKDPRKIGDKYYHFGEVDEDLIGIIQDDPDKRKIALKFIKNLKDIGKKAGEELRENQTESQK